MDNLLVVGFLTANILMAINQVRLQMKPEIITAIENAFLLI